MRHQLEEILKEELRKLAITTRDELQLTQREMAERLEMSESSYSDIETGKIDCCSTLTAILLLYMQEEERTIFLDSVYQRFQQWYEREMAFV